MVLPLHPTKRRKTMAEIRTNPLVEEAYIRESKNCVKIINEETGNAFERLNDPKQRWEVLYKDCKLKAGHGDRFSFVYEQEEIRKDPVSGVTIYDEGVLRVMSMPKLREIAAVYNVTDREKNALIRKIMAEQEAVPVKE
jgi:hypothetical protein